MGTCVCGGGRDSQAAFGDMCVYGGDVILRRREGTCVGRVCVGT